MDEQKVPEKKKSAAALYEWAEAAIFALICVVLVFTFLFRIVGVDGDSMKDTLINNDRLILVHNFYTPARGDIVVINRYVEEPLVKRVIAVEGDTIDIDDEGTVWLNNAVLEEPYIRGTFTSQVDFQGPYTVPKGYVFVMGDNRAVSHDSRSADISAIKVKDIMGKAVFRIWPLKAIGGLYKDYSDIE